MDKDINQLYANDIGISFRWRHVDFEKRNKIQLVFKDTGMFLTTEQLTQFSEFINSAVRRTSQCSKCELNSKCKSILLETPVKLLSFAVNYVELTQIKELVDGTFFKIELDNFLVNNNIKQKKGN